MADVEFKHVDKGKAKFGRSMKNTREHVVLVGVPGTAKIPTKGNNGTVDNMAELAFIMEKGSNVNKIPPRPFMRQTRERAEKRFQVLLRKFSKAIVSGKISPNSALSKLGVEYEGEMKGIFTSGHFEPNRAITIHGGWMRNKVSGKPFKVEGKGSSRPLMDTGRLRQSIISKVVKDSKKLRLVKI